MARFELSKKLFKHFRFSLASLNMWDLQFRRLVQLIPHILIFSIVLVLAIPFIFGNTRYIASNIYDDSYYYLNVARNAALGYGLSFDRINPTNGFHPLWMLFLLPVFRFELDLDSAFRLVLLSQVAIVFASLEILFWGLDRTYRLFLCAVLPFVLFVRFSYLLVSGLESPLVFLFLIIAFVSFIRVLSVNPSKKRMLLLGFAFAMLFLARLDYFVFIAAGILFLLIIRVKRGQKWKPILTDLLLVCIPTFVSSLIYLAWNWSVFGHITTISSALKTTFPIPQPVIGQWTMLFPEYLLVVFLAILFLVFFGIWKLGWKIGFSKKCLDSLARHSLTSLAVAWICLSTVIHYSFVTLFGKWGVDAWYFVGYIVTFLVTASVSGGILTSILGRPRLRIVLAAGIGITAIVVALVSNIVAINNRIRGDAGFTPSAYDAALWVKNHLPESAILGMNDAGIFGYFSDRSVVNLDGIINNFEYQEYLRRGDFAAYLKDKGITFLIKNAVSEENVLNGKYDCISFGSYSRLYEVNGGTVQVCKNQEVFRSEPFRYRAHIARLVIWNLSAPR